MFFTKNIIFILSLQAPAILLGEDSSEDEKKPEKFNDVEISLNPQSGETFY